MDIKEWLGEDNQLGIDIWTKKYRFENESFEEWVNRVSGGDELVGLLIKEKKFLFGGRILASRGLNKKGKKITLSNCYVIEPPEDNIESIYAAASKLARTYSYGGGCGIDISKLSPRGAKINNAAKETSGAVSFMDTYSQVTEQIGQNGRRGALMISLDCNHPDLEEFIDIKTDLNKVTKANISIKITDDFMNAVVNKELYDLTFTREETGETITKTVDAEKIFRRLAENNWNYGEPGCLFWDRIKSWNLLSEDSNFEYAGTNPCAEEPLPAGGSCLLGSLNLAEFVTPSKLFDFDCFEKAVAVAVQALNDVLDEGMPLHPLKEQRDSVRDWRQIGLGIFGLADMYIKLGVEYGSDLSFDLAQEIGRTLIEKALLASARLAKARGCYPNCNKEAILKSKFFKAHASTETIKLVKEYGLYNSQLLTIAPTGTLSTMLGVSGGIEPIFANYYTRTTKSLHGKDVTYKVYTPIVQKYMNDNNITDDKLLPRYFVTAQNLDPKDRVNMQSIWQSYIDASISSTVNLPYEATIDEVFDIYVNAWVMGLKGITIFRDGCARAAILTTRTEPEKKDTEDKPNTPKRGEVLPASDKPIGLKRKLMTGCGSLHCTAFFDPETKQLVEVYLSKGSTGGCNNFMIGLSRMISMAARGGISLNDIVDQLMSTGSCPSYAVRAATHHDTSRGSCCPMAVGYALKDMYKEFQGLGEVTVDNAQKKKDKAVEQIPEAPLCPTCGEPLTFEGGCNICKACGYSKCD